MSNDSERVKNVEIAIDLIEYLSIEQKKIGVREASRLLNVPKSTIQRIFNSLSYKGIIISDKESDQYQLGFKIAKFASRFIDSNNLVTVSSPFLRQLQEETGETVCLYVRVDQQILPILQFESEEGLRVTLKVGRTYPLNTGACGKLISAYTINTQEELDSLLPYFSKMTENSVVDQHEFTRELETIKQQGFSISKAEMLEGVVALAVPILHKEQLVASIGLYGPEIRLNQDLVRSYLDKLKHAQHEISSRLTSIYEG
jgi:IclR family acetate operon transcriptional repressor